MNGTDRARDDDTAELEEIPSGGLDAPWEAPLDRDPDGDAEASGEPAAGESDGAAESTGTGSSADAGDVSIGQKLLHVLPRILALLVFVGLPITLGWSFFVWYFQLGLIGQLLSLFGFAYLVKWGLRPHVDDFFTHPSER